MSQLSLHNKSSTLIRRSFFCATLFFVSVYAIFRIIFVTNYHPDRQRMHFEGGKVSRIVCHRKHPRAEKKKQLYALLRFKSIDNASRHTMTAAKKLPFKLATKKCCNRPLFVPFHYSDDYDLMAFASFFGRERNKTNHTHRDVKAVVAVVHTTCISSQQKKNSSLIFAQLITL